MCTTGATPILHLIPMTTDLTNIPADFKVLASGISGPEGPAIGPDGELYLVSAEDASIICVSPDGGIKQVAKTGGRPNGLVFNKAGEMYVADADLKAILHIDSSTATKARPWAVRTTSVFFQTATCCSPIR